VTTIVIPSRFNGPPASANGGYSCGVIASQVGDGAEVTLRRPPPLDTPLSITVEDGVTLVHDGAHLVAEARTTDWAVDVVAPPGLAEATAASSRYVGHTRHEFPTCFVCGIDRRDGLKVWPGRLPDSDVVATPVTFDDVPHTAGMVNPEIIWAVLDCPGAWATLRDMTIDPVVLGRMAARIQGEIMSGETLIAYAWPLGDEGRKSQAATALADREGRVLAYALQTWIAVRRG
jgi:hypothetical protein